MAKHQYEPRRQSESVVPAAPIQTAITAAPEGDSLFDELPGPDQAHPGPDDPLSTWHELPAPPTGGRYGLFPYNHAPVLLTPDGVQVVVAQWQTTRRFKKKWELTGFWAERNTGGREIQFTPKGYREIKD